MLQLCLRLRVYPLPRCTSGNNSQILPPLGISTNPSLLPVVTSGMTVYKLLRFKFYTHSRLKTVLSLGINFKIGEDPIVHLIQFSSYILRLRS